MYLDHFRLDQEPFSIAPDPSFLYLSESHNEALAHLLYGFSHGGFVLVTGEVGTGKTTLLRNLVKQTPDELDVAFVLNPRLTVRELLETVCDELGLQYDKAGTQTVKQFIDILNRHLLKVHREGRSTVLIIDEAQNLSPAVLEQIRLLTNLETDEKKLLRIILIGQPELDEMLDRKELRQLAQRITARYHLTALNAADTSAYVAHRITRAGGQADIFPHEARKSLFKVSGGIPRLINVIADRALLGAFTRGEYRVTPEMVRAAAQEIAGNRKRRTWSYPWIAAAAIGVILLVMAWALWQVEPDETAPPPQVPEETKEPSPRPTEPVQAQPEPDPEPVARDEPPPDPIRTEPASADPQEPDEVRRPPGSSYRSQRLAYVDLYRLWGLTYNPDSEQVPCDFGPEHGLICTSRRGTWTDLANIDMPVVLELWDDQPLPFYGTLVGMTESTVQLVVGGNALKTSPRALRDLWFGNYTLAWRAPQHYRGNIQAGQRGAAVTLLRDKLSKALSEDLRTSQPDYLDDNLADALGRFQSRAGVAKDGIVGPLTWVALAKLEGDPMPRLAGER